MRGCIKHFSFRLLRLCAFVLMLIQIILGILWMAQNIQATPLFGDSTEYLNLSYTFILDEYRPVLYPFIIRCIRYIGKHTYMNFNILLYGFQTIISFGSIYFFVSIIDYIMGLYKNADKKRYFFRAFFTLYLMTIPMITFMNFTILTDSLATSMMILFLSALMLLFSVQRARYVYLLIIISVIAQSLLRADRLYSCILLTFICFLIKILKSSGVRKRIIIAMLSVCLISVGAVKGIGHFTQTPGAYGRVQTSLDFILLDRIVWPNMTANYGHFSSEIQSYISWEEAQEFDSHNNKVMYQMAPLLQTRVGKDKAEQIYREMASVVFANQPQKVLTDIGEDVLAMIATPFSSYLNTKGRCNKADSWNIYCLSSETPELTVQYNSFYHYSFMSLLVIGILICIILKVEKQELQILKLFRKLMPCFGMCIILTLWFSLGDGAPPNDRYALIIYLSWSLVSLGFVGTWREWGMHNAK